MAYDIYHRQAKAHVGYRRFQAIMSLDILFCGVISKFSVDTLAVWRAREMHVSCSGLRLCLQSFSWESMNPNNE